jgi:hypothetical protein
MIGAKRHDGVSLPNPIQAAHVPTQRIGNDHAAVFLLVIFQHRNQGTTDGKTGAVECVNE